MIEFELKFQVPAERGAEVESAMRRGQVRAQLLFQLETGVIGANCDFHVPLTVYGSESRRA